VKIYVSGTFTAQQRLAAMAHRLREMGHEITGSWLQESSKPAHLTYDQWMAHLGSKDVAEVFRADCIIMDVTDASTSGGRYTEFGVAAHPSSTMLRYVVGGELAKGSAMPYGCFIHLAHRYFPTWEDVFEFFAANHPGVK
jgi:hypothetical protein